MRNDTVLTVLIIGVSASLCMVMYAITMFESVSRSDLIRYRQIAIDHGYAEMFIDDWGDAEFRWREVPQTPLVMDTYPKD